MKTWALILAVSAALIPQVANAQWPTSTPVPTAEPADVHVGPFAPISADDWTINHAGDSMMITATLRNHTGMDARVTLRCESAPGERVVTLIDVVPSPLRPGESGVATGVFPTSKTSPWLYGCSVLITLAAPQLPTDEPTQVATVTPTATDVPPTVTPVPTWTVPPPTLSPPQDWRTWLPSAWGR